MTDETNTIDRRAFMTGAIGIATGLGATTLLSGEAAAQAPGPGPGGPPPGMGMGPPVGLFRLEADVRDCEVEGKVPLDLNGAFYRVGPDA